MTSGPSNERRDFIKSVATGAAALSLAMIAPPIRLSAAPVENDPGDADAWFNKVKGKHRMAFDVAEPDGIFPFAMPKVFLLTNAGTGTPAADTGVVVILRHNAVPLALENRLWEKYRLGDAFKVDDPKTTAPAVRNIFWQPGPEDFVLPGIGAVQIGVNDLQADGVMICVCNVALTNKSAVAAKKMNLDPKEVYKEWTAGLLPAIQIVPSGVWAVGRAQEHGCAYCYIG